MKQSINGSPVPYDLPKEELFTLLASDNVSDFTVACEALSRIPDEDVCDCMGAYLTSGDKYRRLAVLKVIFRNPYAVKFTPVLEEAIQSGDILFAENGLAVAYAFRVAVADDVIVATVQKHIKQLYDALNVLDLLAVHEANYQALISIFEKCVTSLQQEVVADILARKYADIHAAELFELFGASAYAKVRQCAVTIGARYGFDVTRFEHDPDGHVRKAMDNGKGDRLS